MEKELRNWGLGEKLTQIVKNDSITGTSKSLNDNIAKTKKSKKIFFRNFRDAKSASKHSRLQNPTIAPPPIYMKIATFLVLGS